VIKDKLSVGAKTLYGPGVGRYAQSTLADVTANSWGGLAPIHNLAGLLSVEATPTPRLALYAYYGGEYAARADYGSASASTLGSPSAKLGTAGTWGGTWAAATGNQPVGYGSRLLNNSGTAYSTSNCNTITNPGLNGSSTGYYTGGSCGAQTRAIQEVTGGYWYDIYKGDMGRLRQGVQYEYGVREGWSGLSGIGAKGIDNMVLTSLRYYLP
jgi:hypothetical protein